jgi:ABC-2 type transport system permease protein
VDGKRLTSPDAPTFGLMMPLFITLAFLFMILTSSGYMMGALIEEKENRTMEVLITSISPTQLMAGKIIGIVAISLTLLLVWSIVITGGVLIAAQAGIEWFSDLSMDWRGVLETFAIGIPAYVLAASLMIAIGALAGTNQESQAVSTIIFTLHALPLYVSVTFINSPHGPLQTALTLLPFSALMTIGMRNVFTIVPLWQVFASFAVQCLCAVGAAWLAGRALRFGMEHYGLRFKWRALVGLIRRNPF